LADLRLDQKGPKNQGFASPMNGVSASLRPAGYFFLDKKVAKNQGPNKICLISLRKSGKKYFSTDFLRLLPAGKFLNGRFLE
jgi:hypothetical protein